MPLAMVLVHNNKGRFQIGFLQGKHLRPDITGNKLPTAIRGLQCPAEARSTFCNFDSDEIRANEKLIPQDAAVERVYVRAISGHGKRFTWLDLGNIHRRFEGEQPTVAGWLVHGTQEYHLSSIRREGLRAGGKSGSRKHIHFIKDTQLVSDPRSTILPTLRLDMMQFRHPMVTFLLRMTLIQISS